MELDILILFITGLSTVVNGDGSCKVLEYFDCRKNKALTGHVVESYIILAPGLKECQHICYMEDKCVSYNLGPVNGMIRTCEVNDADHVSHPGHVVSKEDFEYCPIKNPCSSSPCPSSQWCTPDFYWNTFKCSYGKLTEWNQWSSCSCGLPSEMRRYRHCMSPMNTSLPSSSCKGSNLTESKECKASEIFTGCSGPLGMQDRSIPDAQITASSVFSLRFKPFYGRLKNFKAWSSERPRINEYLQIDLGSAKWVTKIATQGLSNEWVTKYVLSYTNNTGTWKEYKVYQACTKHMTYVLPTPIKTRYVRFLSRAWRTWVTMRVELYGCTSV